MIVGFLFGALGSYRGIMLGMIPLSLVMAGSTAALWRRDRERRDRAFAAAARTMTPID